jgi:hypothetical protein
LNTTSDLQSGHPEKFLYHYTSQNGFMGIINSKKIWATNILYLNDTEEIKQAIWVTMNCLKIIADSSKSRSEKEFIDEFYRRAESITRKETDYGIYVCSFSAMPDLLSQWRGYCPDANGICIGFDFNSEIYEQIKAQGFSLIKCEYADQYGIPPLCIKKFLNETIEAFNTLPQKMKLSDRINKSLNGFDQKLLSIATSIKHPAFIEENEWRLISEPISVTNPNIKYRAGKSMLIPYIEINLTNDKSDFLNIPEIWVGPTPHPELAVHSLESYLNYNQIFAYRKQIETPFDDEITRNSEEKEATQVYISKVPYCTW